MASLGQELKRERELRSVSLRDISEQTKIGIRHLQALEDDRLDLLPGKFLTKAILRSYARAIGADEDRILNKFHEEALALEEKSRREERARPEAASAEDGETRSRRRTLRIVLITAAAFLAALACFYVFVLSPRQADSPAGIVTQSTTSAPAFEDEAAADPETAPSTDAAVPAKEEGIRLEFEFDAPSWMHITADGVVVYEGIREAGATETVEAETEVILQTGNAGGFRLRINGRPARPLGQPGKVLTDVRIRRDNLSLFLEPGK
jgi:cytoskeleton protein RodZ